MSETLIKMPEKEEKANNAAARPYIFVQDLADSGIQKNWREMAPSEHRIRWRCAPSDFSASGIVGGYTGSAAFPDMFGDEIVMKHQRCRGR